LKERTKELLLFGGSLMAASVPAEFSVIARHFAPLAGEGALGLRDDAAVFTPPAGRELVVSADAMVGGVHFLPDDPARDIARKLLRANLSDIAAMGAVPIGYLLTLSVPRETPDAWIGDFAAGLALDQAAYGICLFGGDTTSTPGPVSLSVTMFGHVAPGAAWRRSGARAGDDVWVTGVIGDGVLGLWALRAEVDDPDGSLALHYRLPSPRVGLRLHGIVSAAMDISDGLLQDAGHMARASGVGMEIALDAVPLSAAGRAAGADFVSSGVAGGDDYELLLTAPVAKRDALVAAAREAGVAVTRIGQCVADEGVRCVGADGRVVEAGGGGWSHF
jgi:thiamine-monophosphate kinase